jgi:hypothetical protein
MLKELVPANATPIGLKVSNKWCISHSFYLPPTAEVNVYCPQFITQ